MFRSPFTRHGSADRSGSSCPRCRASVPVEDINVGADTALCRSCGGTCTFSALIHGRGNFNLSQPPAGVLVEQSASGFQASATTRSLAALFLVPFACVWSALTLVGIYGRQIKSGRFDLMQSLFGIPFFIGTLFVAAQALMSIFGRIAVLREGDDGAVFTGVGSVGWRRPFRWSDVVSVAERDTGSDEGVAVYRQIAIRTVDRGVPRTIAFGTMLSRDRREFMVSLIRSQIGR